MSRVFLALALATLLTSCSLLDAPPSPTAVPTRPAAATPSPAASPTASPAPKATAAATKTRGATPTVKASKTVTATAPSAATQTLMNGIANKVAAARGLAFKSKVSVGVLARDQVRPYLIAKLNEEQGKEELEKSRAVLVLMGMLKEEDDLYELSVQLLTDQVLGFYELDTGMMRLVGIKNPPSVLDEMTIAHEYTHALQDQNFGLGAKVKQAKGKDELTTTLHALSEGDATISSLEYIRQNKKGVTLSDLQSDASGVDQARLAAMPPVLRIDLLFPYQQGTAFAGSLYRAGGWAALNKAYANPPQTSEQIFHPEKYEAGEGARKVTLPEIAPALGVQWSVVEDDMMGELFWYEYLAPHVSPNESRDAVTGWGGDHYVLLKNAEGKYALAALTIWDAADEAREFDETTLTALGDPARDLKITSMRNSRVLWSAPGLSGYASLKNDQVLFVVSPDLDATKKIVARFGGFPAP